jgi:light-regulated signal transduction histidine kinase (bacteriophytochrome)
MEPWRERAAGRGFRSSASLPLLDGKKVLGSLSIYSADVDAFTPEAVQLFSELASNVGFGIASLRLREERERMRAALQDRTLELESAVKELEAFAYSVSHDLRAPLRSIDGFSQILLEDYTDQLDESGKDCLRRVRAGCQNMGQLIDAVLQLSRITRSEMHPEMVDLSLLALGEAAMLQRLAPGRQVEIRIASGLQARGDRKLLQVALQNLMENAWKFTSKQPAARIEVGSTERDGRQVFFVRDNGAGFDMTYASKLFQPFQRLHSKDDYEGTGIGLASVQRIVQRLGGKIWAEGTPGRGATFYFYFT